jgi:hypothetical protein
MPPQTSPNSGRGYASIEDFIAKEVPKLEKLQLPNPPLTHVLVERRIPSVGLWLEFGVWKGYSINVMAEYTDKIVYGFDSFTGLPEDWRAGASKGRYSVGGTLPPVKENVRLVQGWFEDTLPPFLKEHPENVAILHIDCDIYSSTKTVLTYLRDRIVPGTVIVFDEMFNYPEYRDHELKAFVEFLQETGMGFEWIGAKGPINLNPDAEFEKWYYDQFRGFGLKIAL